MLPGCCALGAPNGLLLAPPLDGFVKPKAGADVLEAGSLGAGLKAGALPVSLGAPPPKGEPAGFPLPAPCAAAAGFGAEPNDMAGLGFSSAVVAPAAAPPCLGAPNATPPPELDLGGPNGLEVGAAAPVASLPPGLAAPNEMPPPPALGFVAAAAPSVGLLPNAWSATLGSASDVPAGARGSSVDGGSFFGGGLMSTALARFVSISPSRAASGSVSCDPRTIGSSWYLALAAGCALRANGIRRLRGFPALAVSSSLVTILSVASFTVDMISDLNADTVRRAWPRVGGCVC
jgi:hypothetical protein